MKLTDLYEKRPDLRNNVPERFWSKVAIEGKNDCWLWQASVTLKCRYNNNHSPGGYGRFAIGGFNGTRCAYALAHRIAFMLTYGEIPDDLACCHSCDTPACCNPAHLWLGTRFENNKDRDAKGRTRRGPLSPGELNCTAKLTDAAVLECRLRVRNGESRAHLAKEFAVSTSAISQAVLGRTFKHLPPESVVPAKSVHFRLGETE